MQTTINSIRKHYIFNFVTVLAVKYLSINFGMTTGFQPVIKMLLHRQLLLAFGLPLMFTFYPQGGLCWSLGEASRTRTFVIQTTVTLLMNFDFIFLSVSVFLIVLGLDVHNFIYSSMPENTGPILPVNVILFNPRTDCP